MHHFLTIEHITAFVEIHRYTGYLILFFAMMLEGEFFLIVAGMLASLKAFDIGDTFFISLIGVLIGDVLWYGLGNALQGKVYAMKLLRHAEKSVLFFLPRFRERPFKSIFFSKFIYGVNHATLIMSGVLRVKFRLFMKAEVLASFAWVVLFLTAGYFFGSAAIWFSHRATRFILIVVLFMVVFVLLRKILIYRYEKRIQQTNA